MNKLILTAITIILMVNIVGCTTSSESNPEQTMVETQESVTDSEENLVTYDETAQGIPVKTQYPPTMEVSGMGSGEGVGVFFKFKSQGNALDQSEVHFFFPAGAKTATEVKTYVKGSNGLMASNGWTLVENANPPQELMYPWVKEIITFSSDKKMMGHILLGEINDQALQVVLLYPGEMADAYWPDVKAVLENVEFEPNLLPIKGTEESSGMKTDSDRSVYKPLPLPDNANLVGDDPKKIAVDVFGITEPVEGNFQEQVALLEKTDNRVIVTLTQIGLPDDSVEGTRYWLEFIRNDQQKWQLNWSGHQVRCYSGRGSQMWSRKNCS